jgi:acetyl esterase/lipase
MIKLILLLLLFLLSLLVIFRAPTNLLWYVSILVTEFSWVFILLVLLVLFLPVANAKLNLAGTITGSITILLLFLPYWQAWRLSDKLKQEFRTAFGKENIDDKGVPFNPLRVFTGIGSRKAGYQTLLYDQMHHQALHFYKAEKEGRRPCVIVIHGGSWAAGNNLQLPELNSELAKAGYHVAGINYRLAPSNHYPAPIEDVQTAIRFLTVQATALSLDTTRFVLLGRSAGGQVALSAAYTLAEPAIKGVINFYGPADMVWGYDNPTNPLVLDSRKVMEDYLGGTLDAVPRQYSRSSATESVTAKTPPTLMIYAENDPLVSPRHGNRLSDKLSAAGIPHFALYLPWATHGFDYTLHGPGGQLSTWTVQRFLEAILKEE